MERVTYGNAGLLSLGIDGEAGIATVERENEWGSGIVDPLGVGTPLQKSVTDNDTTEDRYGIDVPRT
jgi:hypothetical protein